MIIENRDVAAICIVHCGGKHRLFSVYDEHFDPEGIDARSTDHIARELVRLTLRLASAGGPQASYEASMYASYQLRLAGGLAAKLGRRLVLVEHYSPRRARARGLRDGNINRYLSQVAATSGGQVAL